MEYLLKEENAETINLNLLGAIESILFFSGEPVDINQIKSSLELSKEEIDNLIDLLKLKYSKEDSGIKLIIMDRSLQLVTKEEFYPLITRVLSLEKKKSLSKAGAEVLAILAYNEPLTRLEIDQIRGVNSTGSLQRLIDQGLVEISGKKDVIGKPNLYKTTEQFLKLAGLENLEELPSFDYFKNKLQVEEENDE